MTRTREITDGVLLRPFESLATNFLSSRYYDGRRIIDLLDSRESAEHWMSTVHAHLHGPAPFLPTATQLDRLRTARTHIEALYEKVVTRTLSEADVAAFNATSSVTLSAPQLRVVRIGDVDTLTFRTTSESSESNAFVALSIAAMDTLTGPRSRILRKCHAPRCVLYFTQFDSRQHWCSNVCGNRARVARAAVHQRSST